MQHKSALKKQKIGSPLKAQLKLQDAVMQAASSGIIIVDRKGKIIMANAAVTALTGFRQEDMLGKNPRIFKSGKHGNSFYENMWKTVVSGKVWKGELVNKRKDGTFYDEEMVITPIKAARNKVTHFIAFKQNIAERKFAEERRDDIQRTLLQSEKLSALGQLAAGIAHELNNPLGVILGFVQSAAKNVPPGDPLSVAFRSIERETERCRLLVQQLLTFSRKPKMIREKSLLNEEISLAVSLIETKAKIQSIELISKLDPSPPPIMINRNQIQQVIVNLCNNAIDAMPSGGKLQISSGHINQGERLYVFAEVSDTGSGIPKEIVHKIFDPYFTTKEDGKGTGLGLALVQQIVNFHQGWVEAASSEGKGTTMKIFLPIKEGPHAIKRILIVDDEPDIRKLLEGLLASDSREVFSAQDGVIARRMLQELIPDLMVLDVYVPDVDGFQVCCAIRSDPRLKDIKILAISGKRVDETGKAILKAGADDFLAKPFEIQAFHKKVSRLLNVKK